MRIGTAVIIVWLIIGAIAAGQRHYYNSSSTNCAKTSTIAVTIIAGAELRRRQPENLCPKPS